MADRFARWRSARHEAEVPASPGEGPEPASAAPEAGADVNGAPAPEETPLPHSPSPAAAGPATWLQAAQRCHIGLLRGRNEDSTFAFSAESGGQDPLLPFGLYIVADGMGGHHAGHEASRSVARTVARHVLDRIYLPMLYDSEQSPAAREPIGAVMQDAVQSANDHLHSPDPDKDSGTTLTAALFLARRLHVTHVGDSRAYLFTQGELKLLTTDHSYVQRLQDAGQITAEEAAVHPQRNMLYNAVGQGGGLAIDTYTQMLPAAGKVVLCSDGLWGLVTRPAIEQALGEDLTLQESADRLVDLALAAGGLDNISVIVIDFRF